MIIRHSGISGQSGNIKFGTPCIFASDIIYLGYSFKPNLFLTTEFGVFLFLKSL